MPEGIIIRLPGRNLQLSRKKDNLYLSNAGVSGGRLVMHGCTEHFDAAASVDGLIYIVCGNSEGAVLLTCAGDDIEAQKIELPAGSENYRLHLVGKVLSLGYTAPTGGGHIGLYHVLPHTGDQPALIGRCSSSARPFSSAVDMYGNILFVFATHDASICGIDYIWSKKTFGKQYTIGSYFASASSPHIMADRGRVHCTYVAKDKEGCNLMYYNDNTHRPETVFEGCSPAGMPVLVRIREQVCIVWNQYGVPMIADTWHGTSDKIETKKYFSEPSLVALRLPEPLRDYCCSEIYARIGEGGYRPVVGEGMLAEDLSHLKARKVIMPGQEAEMLFKESFAAEIKMMETEQALTELPPQKAEPDDLKPDDGELTRIAERVERLEKAVEGAALVIDGTVKELLSLGSLQGEIKSLFKQLSGLNAKVDALSQPVAEIRNVKNEEPQPEAPEKPKKRGTRKKKESTEGAQ